MTDDYKKLYDEAMVASNEVGFVGMTPAETIRAQAAVIEDVLPDEWQCFQPPISEVVKRLRAERGFGERGLQFVNDYHQALDALERILKRHSK